MQEIADFHSNKLNTCTGGINKLDKAIQWVMLNLSILHIYNTWLRWMFSRPIRPNMMDCKRDLRAFADVGDSA